MSKAQPNTPETQRQPNHAAELRLWQPALRAFLVSHPSWAARLALHTPPQYTLPDEVVDELSRSTSSSSVARYSRPLLRAGDADAERAFTALCRTHSQGVVGVWNGSPVSYSLFERPRRLTREEFDDTVNCGAMSLIAGEMDKDRAARLQELTKNCPPLTYESYTRALDSTESEIGFYNHQAIGWAGLATFDPNYQQQIRDLRKRDEALGHLFRWPLTAGIVEHERAAALDPVLFCSDPANPERAVRIVEEELPETTGECSTRQLVTMPSLEPATRLCDDTVRFLARWNLTSLASWELPVPQGPLSNLPPAATAQLLNPYSTVSLTPPYLNPPDPDTLRHSRSASQKAAATISGQGVHLKNRNGKQSNRVTRGPMPCITGRDGGPSENETAFRMWFVEHTVRSRYGAPHGLVARLSAAFERLHERSADHVKRLRRMYTHLFQNDAAT